MKPDFLPDLDEARRLLLELDLRGVVLEARGHRLHYNAPPGVMSDEIKARLRVNRSLIVTMITAGRSPSSDASTPVQELMTLRLHCPYPSHSDWTSIYGTRVCRVCHPPASPALIARELA